MNDPKTITPDHLLELLREAGRPVTRRELSENLGLTHAESDERIKPVLLALIRDGKVVRNRRAAYGLTENMDLVRGRVSAHADGFGFMVPDEDGGDLFLPPHQMQQVFDGDRVLASVVNVDHRGRKEGQIVEVLERARAQIVGRYVVESGVAMVVPDDPKLTHEVLIPNLDTPGLTPGKIVVARITRPPSFKRSPVGEIVSVLGEHDEPGMATQIAVFNHQLPADFPDEVVREAEAFGDRIDPKRAEGRMDLRDLPLVTIDGADARDFDDAVYAAPHGDGWRLIVAIADVSEYVTPGSALDDEAQKRGTSTYFPDRVIPMLPEALSNGLCSLNPEVERLVMVCDMTLDAKGKITGSRFAEGVMRSAARLTYDQVRQMIELGDAELRERYGHLIDDLEHLYAVYRLLAKKRDRRGAIDFDSSEVNFIFDTQGRVEQLRRRTRHDAHKLIEECMIAANVQAAKTAETIERPVLYRVHDVPPPDKLAELESFLSAHGLAVDWKDEPQPADLTRIQKKARGTPIAPLVDAVLLRSLALAVYQPENKGHFGLALEAYSHFTSPIRRYPDLLLHRALKAWLRKEPVKKYPYSKKKMAELGRECSYLDRRAEEASREVDERLKCQFMLRHVGDEFDGVITGVTGFGCFVELPEMGVSGLVHITSLPNDYYHFDPTGRVLTGERRGLRFRLADPVRIEVLSVSVDERKIDFRIAGDENASDPAKRAGGRKPPGGKARKGGGRKGGGKPGRKGGKKRGGPR